MPDPQPVVSGNIDLYDRPKVPNQGGSSTVYSASFDIDGREVLLPLADDGRILSDDEAIDRYRRTGQHLGIFRTPQEATRFAERLHNDYAAGKYERRPDVPDPQTVDYDALARESGGTAIDDAAAEFGGVEVSDEPTPDFSTRTTPADGLAPSLMQQVAARSAPVLGEGLSHAIGTAADVQVGAAKGAGNTVLSLSKLAMRMPAMQALVARATGMSPDEVERRYAALDEAVKPTNTAQAIGRTGEQIAETLIPGRMVTKGATAAAAYLPRGLQTAGRMVVEGAGGAGMATAQGSDPMVAGGVSAAIPVAGRVVGSAASAVGARVAPAMEGAMDLARRRGIPVDAATATGSRVVRAAQDLIGRGTFGGAMVRDRAEQARETAMARVGRELADEAMPTAAAAEQAGEGLRHGVTEVIEREHAAANEAYSLLREMEADPRHIKQVQTGTRTVDTGVLRPDGTPVTRTEAVTEAIAMPVDMRKAKDALRPIMDRMHRQLPVTIARSSPGLKAIENIVNGPDYVPASIADTDLGIIKGISREADLPQLRDLSQGLAARAVSQLENAVQAAVGDAGQQAVEALAAGRAATRAKYGAAEVLKAIRNEPVQAFNQAVYAHDAGINQLREVAKLAPQEMPKVGRAYLDKLLAQATEKGGFGREEGIFRAWQNLGPETKKILFPNTPLRHDLDAFFTLATKSAENINKSGSGFTAMLAVQGGWAFADPAGAILAQLPAAAVAKMMHSPAGVRLLTQGLKLPSLNPTTAANVLEQLRRAGERAATTSPPAVPAGPAPTPSGRAR